MSKKYLNFLPFLGLAFIFTSTLKAQDWARNLPPGANFQQITRAFNAYYGNTIPDKGEESAENAEYLQFRRWENFMKYRLDENGQFKPNQLFAEKSRIASEKSMNSINLSNWTFLGPDDVPGGGGGMGRLDAIRFQPGHPDTVWVGAANGGLWKSTDGGVTWSSNTDFLPNLGVADIAIDPIQPANMFIATGDGFGYPAGGVFWGGTYSSGVMKSTDGGLTWNTTGLSYLVQNNKIVQRLHISSLHPNTVLAGTTDGLYRTADGGTTWSNVLPGHHVYDIQGNTANDSVIYCSSDNSIYKSSDVGATWTLLSNAIGTVTGRVTLAVTPANSQVIYALEPGGSLYASTDGGQNFTATTNQPASTVTFYGYYDMALNVSPLNANLVYVGGLEIGQSSDGGNTWSVVGDWQGWPATTYVHADNHRLEFFPGTSTLYSCNDGGLFKTTDNGTSWTNLSHGLCIGQIYRLGSSATQPNLIFTGFQDNGNVRMNGTTWDMVNMADGMECVVDWSNPSNVIVTTQYGSMAVSSDGGNTFNPVTPSSFSGAWTIPLIEDPTNASVYYAGYEDVYKSTDGGNSWTPISSNLTSGGALTMLAQSRLHPATIYAGDPLDIWVTNNGGTSWSTNLAVGLPLTGNSISAMAVSDVNPRMIWVTLSGYQNGQKVFKSIDGGQTWTNYSGSLPNVPADAITLENYSNESLYLGTDLGVYFRDSTMSDWMLYNNHLPNVIVDELEINYSAGKIRAATYGRGLWESPLQDVTGIPEKAQNVNFNLYPNPSTGTLCIRGQVSTLKKVSVMNLPGQELFSIRPEELNPHAVQYNMDLSQLPDGIYFIRLDTENGSSTSKVILTR